MELAVPQVTGGYPTPFNKPAGVIERVVCAVSGTEPSQWCPEQRSEFFAADQPPLPADQDLWAKVTFDTWTGLRASAACGTDFRKEDYALNVTDPFAVKWIKEDSAGRAWAADLNFSDPVRFIPERECRADDPRPNLAISSPSEGQTINSSTLDIIGKASATANFESLVVDYGLGNDPVEWNRLYETGSPLDNPDKIFTWDIKDIPAGTVTLRFRMHSTQGGLADLFIHLNMQVPTPTPTPSPTPTATPIPTLTPTPSEGGNPNP
jgi:hypothetical protein